MNHETVSVLDGSTFVVSDRRGDIDAQPDVVHGLFFQDTRFLSRWRLVIEDRDLDVLSTDDFEYFAAQFFLFRPSGSMAARSNLSILRQRYVGDGFHEDLQVLNHSGQPLRLELHVDAAADFADLFEVKDVLTKQGERYTRCNPTSSSSVTGATPSCARR